MKRRKIPARNRKEAMAQRSQPQYVPIPEELRVLLVGKFNEHQLTAWGTEALVVEAVREHIISRRKAATLLGFQDYTSRQAFFERHELFNEYTMEMLDQDFKTIDLLNDARRIGRKPA
jgi:hypothetical protein